MKQTEQKRQQATYKDLPRFNRLVEEVKQKQKTKHHQNTNKVGGSDKQHEQK